MIFLFPILLRGMPRGASVMIFHFEDRIEISELRIVYAAAVSDRQIRDRCDRKEGEVEYRIRQAAADFLRAFLELDFFLRKLFGRKVGCDACDRERKEGDDLAIDDNDLTTALTDQGIRSKCHVFAARAGYDKVVVIRRSRCRDGTFVEGPSGDEAFGHMAVDAIALDDGNHGDVFLRTRAYDAVLHFQFDISSLSHEGTYAVNGLDKSGALFDIHMGGEIIRSEERMLHGIGEGGLARRDLVIETVLSFFGDELAFADDGLDLECTWLVDEEDVSVFTRRDRATWSSI